MASAEVRPVTSVAVHRRACVRAVRRMVVSVVARRWVVVSAELRRWAVASLGVCQWVVVRPWVARRLPRRHRPHD